ncbi:MAG: CoA transferase [Sphingobium sp.]
MTDRQNQQATGLPRPLQGVRVLAIENFVAGPLCSMWLADAGAEVVKVETPGKGDMSRKTSPVKPDEKGEPQGLSFLRTNRNKKSVSLDLKHPEGIALFKQLAQEADIIVENLRPGVMDRLGVGYEALKAINPRIIYVAISGFGQKDILASPYKDRPAFDIIGQALSGLLYRPEREGEKPVYLGFSLADIEAGMVGAYGATLALLQRNLTGQGQMVDISLYDSCLIMNELSVIMYSAFQTIPKPGLHAVTAPFGAYKAKDGYITIATLGEHIWHRLTEVIGRPELVDDPLFKDGISRSANNAALTAALEPWLLQRTRDEAVDALTQGGVPASKVQEVDDLFDCPHLAARNMILKMQDPVWGEVSVAGNPIKMSNVPEIENGLPPRLGEHSRDVLQRWLGKDDQAIARLVEAGVIERGDDAV